MCVCGGGGGGSHYKKAIKKGRGVLPGSRDPYPIPDTIETPFQTKVRQTYTLLLTNNICSFALSVNLVS